MHVASLHNKIGETNYCTLSQKILIPSPMHVASLHNKICETNYCTLSQNILNPVPMNVASLNNKSCEQNYTIQKKSESPHKKWAWSWFNVTVYCVFSSFCAEKNRQNPLHPLQQWICLGQCMYSWDSVCTVLSYEPRTPFFPLTAEPMFSVKTWMF